MNHITTLLTVLFLCFCTFSLAQTTAATGSGSSQADQSTISKTQNNSSSNRNSTNSINNSSTTQKSVLDQLKSSPYHYSNPQHMYNFLGNINGTFSLDLRIPRDNLTAWVKMRASLKDNEEVFYKMVGKVYSYVPGEEAKPLFDVEIYNVAKAQKQDWGYLLLGREVGVFKNLETGEIIEEWVNPYTKDTLDVIQIWNDPVNQQFVLKDKETEKMWGIPFMYMGGKNICMYTEKFPLRPSPLSKKEYPENTRSNNYQAAELTQYTFSEADMNDPKQNSIYSEVYWTQVTDYLPWMNMGERPGHLVFHFRGHKMMNASFEDLPEEVKEFVLVNQPQFERPPNRYTTPNMEPWRYFSTLFKKNNK